jgi:ligand-binding sensor domain-containing protein
MKFLFLLFIYFLSCSLSAQKISFVTYGTNEGLPQSQVTSITQDNQGYLWVGTFGGLGRFNGKDFVTYSTKHGLLNNRISFSSLKTYKTFFKITLFKYLNLLIVVLV